MRDCVTNSEGPGDADFTICVPSNGALSFSAIDGAVRLIVGLNESPLFVQVGESPFGREFQVKPSTKVAEAAITCLSFCRDCDDPKSAAQRFLGRMANKPDWSAEEIEQLRELIVSRLQNGRQ